MPPASVPVDHVGTQVDPHHPSEKVGADARHPDGGDPCRGPISQVSKRWSKRSIISARSPGSTSAANDMRNRDWS
jgi:hypothetical protein